MGSQLAPSKFFIAIKFVLKLMIISGGATLVLLILLWDVSNTYELRDQYERLKIAIWGDWKANDWCPPGRESKECDDKNKFEAVLGDVDDFNFFKFRTVTALNLNIITGISFRTANDVLEGVPEKQWCYTQLTHDSLSQQVQLGGQLGQSTPVFFELDDANAAQVKKLGLSPDELMLAAKRECWFDRFQLLDQDGGHNAES